MFSISLESCEINEFRGVCKVFVTLCINLDVPSVGCRSTFMCQFKDFPSMRNPLYTSAGTPKSVDF